MNIMQGLYVLPLALALGYTAYRTKSVYPCILMHMVNNFMPSLLAVLPESVPTVPVAIIIIVIRQQCYILSRRGCVQVRISVKSTTERCGKQNEEAGIVNRELFLYIIMSV